MTFAGASAETAEAMRKTMLFPGDGKAFHNDLAALVKEYSPKGKLPAPCRERPLGPKGGRVQEGVSGFA